MSRLNAKRPRAEAQQNLQARQAILRVALKAFAVGGFDGASLPKIAQMAEVAPSLIHYYFDSKDRLWRETVDFSLGHLRQETATIRNATRALAPLDRLRALLQALTTFAAAWPDHFGMILAEARSQSDRYTWLQENYTGVVFEDLVSILGDAREQGLIKDVAIDKLALMLLGGILINFTFYPLPPGEEESRQAAEDYTELMFGMLLDGIRVRPGQTPPI